VGSGQGHLLGLILVLGLSLSLWHPGYVSLDILAPTPENWAE